MSGTLPAGVLREHPEGCTLAIRAQPGAKRTAIAGIYGDGEQTALKITLQAPAVEGRANEALVAFLATACGVPKSSVAILSGELARSKVVLIRGLSHSRAQSILSHDLQSQ